MVFQVKKLLFLIGVAGLLWYGVPEVYAAEKALFDDVKVSFKSVKAPNFRASDATSPGRISWQNEWLVIEVEFKPVKPKDENSPYWLDDMTMNVEVLFSCKNNGKEVWRLFTGTSEFWSIPRDGRKHVAAMFIPPQILDRHLLPHPDTFVKVQLGSVTAYDRRNAESAFKNAKDEKNEKALRQIRNAVLPRNLTPWAIVDVDKYDLLKQSAGVSLGAEE